MSYQHFGFGLPDAPSFAAPQSDQNDQYPAQPQQPIFAPNFSNGGTAAQCFASTGGTLPYTPYLSNGPYFGPYPSIQPALVIAHDQSALPSPIPTTPSESTPNDSTPISYADLPGKTNWAPKELGTASNESLSPSSAASNDAAESEDQPSRTNPAFSAAPKSKARGRRAAASRARSTIANITTQLRSPPPPTAPSRPLSRATYISKAGAHSRTSSRASFHPSDSGISFIPPGPAAFDTGGFANSTLQVPIASAGKGRKHLGVIELKNHRGALLPAEPGAILEVNDLLVLQPPAVVPKGKGNYQPQNQYSGAPCPEGYQSVYEMYTCRVCAKTYDGRNARSVARRHLQDKHGVPLALQERRTRWDGSEDRPKDVHEAYDRNKKSKRDWATKRRMLARLERHHVEFLEQYGPGGIITPSKSVLIAYKLRSKAVNRDEDAPVPHHVGWYDMPKSLRDEVASIDGIAIPSLEGQVIHNGQTQPQQAHLISSQSDHLGRSQNDSISSFSTMSSGSDRPPTNQSQALPPLAATHSPSRFAHSAPDFGLKRTPVSNAREGDQQLSVPSGGDWTAWGAATYVDEAALQRVIQQHQSNTAISEDAIIDSLAVQATLAGDPSLGEGSLEVSPPTTASISTALHHQQWSANGETVPSLLQQQYTYTLPPAMKPWMMPTPCPVPMGQNLSSEADGVEAVAAESLLNLHSTPARPDEPTSVSMPSRAIPLIGNSLRSDTPTPGLLAAPQITSLSSNARANASSPQLGLPRDFGRSQSYQQANDDPFAFSPSHVFGYTASKRRKRRSTIASPSVRRKKEKLDDGSLTGSPRRPMASIHPNAGGYMSQIPGPFTTTPWRQPMTITDEKQTALLGSAYITPMRPRPTATAGADASGTADGAAQADLEMSVTKAWLRFMSSPAAEGGTAESLG